MPIKSKQILYYFEDGTEKEMVYRYVLPRVLSIYPPTEHIQKPEKWQIIFDMIAIIEEIRRDTTEFIATQNFSVGQSEALYNHWLISQSRKRRDQREHLILWICKATFVCDVWKSKHGNITGIGTQVRVAFDKMFNGQQEFWRNFLKIKTNSEMRISKIKMEEFVRKIEHSFHEGRSTTSQGFSEGRDPRNWQAETGMVPTRQDPGHSVRNEKRAQQVIEINKPPVLNLRFQEVYYGSLNNNVSAVDIRPLPIITNHHSQQSSLQTKNQQLMNQTGNGGIQPSQQAFDSTDATGPPAKRQKIVGDSDSFFMANNTGEKIQAYLLPDNIDKILNLDGNQGNFTGNMHEGTHMVEPSNQLQSATTDQQTHRQTKRARTLSEQGLTNNDMNIILPNQSAESWNDNKSIEPDIRPANEIGEPNQNDSNNLNPPLPCLDADTDFESFFAQLEADNVKKFDETFTYNGKN
ncbi:Oidioi.mRNA.OKI2018_I69.chr1.g1701.t1.cds [Oikopleura dioica]|uniref:Oidioi.mRNA.OKI2018_I69.chr1.g1701.t1.cds n=1 Tax=Oikopleura dioica TaxID=34765 RepID=A0ABN7SV11_OIKDI|nr:Oidioi.mRNA.OKI2018_I69.chr1.g1701.t1.cds [Oikopleura dioica]